MLMKLRLDDETYDALIEDASRHVRPADWHAKALLRQALGLPMPYPSEPVMPVPEAAAAVAP